MPGVIRSTAAAVLLCGSVVLLRSGTGQQTKPAAASQEQEEDRSAIAAKACGPKVKHTVRTDKSQQPAAEAPGDKALVYVVRPTKYGGKIQTKLAVDGEWKGVNRGNNYFFFTLEPGTHYFCSQSENHSVLALTVEAGKVYYIQQKMRIGINKARNRLEVLDAAEGKKGLQKCQLSVFEEK